MRSESITIKDIANILGLSHSTVARALKDSYQISEATKKIVNDCAKEHNYKPNLMAQSLKGKNNRSIGVLSPAIPNSFFAEVISGIESVAYERNYKLIITQSFESREREIKNLDLLAWHHIDGLLVSLSSETKEFDHFIKLHQLGIPIVFFDRITNSIKTHTVSVNNEEGSYHVTKHMIECGYKKIAHITSSPNLSITQERLKGYLNALDQEKIPLKESLIKYCDHGGMIQEEIEKGMDELFSGEEVPDAIFAASDRITIKTFSYLRKLGLKIPEEIAIAGFSNFSAPELFDPPLTTVKQPAYQMGAVAIELLLKLIESKSPVKYFENIILPTELFIRISTLGNCHKSR
jgi:DNA-binding LacI/PurR family transcriptional regulator